jgi:transcriptional regulator with XRE-family HTH domain
VPAEESLTPLGERLRSRRRKLGLTIAQVADSAGLSLPYVSNLERGRGNPTLDVLTSLAAVLDLPMAQLMGNGNDDVTEDLSERFLASIPPSLNRFSNTEDFVREVQGLAKIKGENYDELRHRVLLGMATAPRRSTGDPTFDDWRRLLDVYTLILRN